MEKREEHTNGVKNREEKTSNRQKNREGQIEDCGWVGGSSEDGLTVTYLPNKTLKKRKNWGELSKRARENGSCDS